MSQIRQNQTEDKCSIVVSNLTHETFSSSQKMRNLFFVFISFCMRASSPSILLFTSIFRFVSSFYYCYNVKKKYNLFLLQCSRTEKETLYSRLRLLCKFPKISFFVYFKSFLQAFQYNYQFYDLNWSLVAYF